VSPGTVSRNPEVGAPEIHSYRKLTFNRFPGHFSDHFASNQQKFAPHAQFRVVGLAHRFWHCAPASFLVLAKT
jgi:acyl dehydratase